MSDITIRNATRSDESSLRLLAELDSQPQLIGDALIAEVCGRPVAALESRSGRAIADPFQPTAEVIELLKIRSHGARRRAGRRHLRLLPRAA